MATDTSLARRWRTPMTARSTTERFRVSTPLELLFDLTFVVAVSQAAAELAHSVEGGHFLAGLSGYLQVFFAIWWAWMNFTWFASGYDTDDVPYRLMTMVQMAGVLVLAAGVPDAFEHGRFAAITLGYAIMRLAMVGQWLRAARSDPATRHTSLRYAAGIALVQVFWLVRLGVAHHLPLLSFVVLAVAEMLVPLWAERGTSARARQSDAIGTRVAWHPHHIAERYGLFTIIVLGECVLAATTAVQASITGHGVSVSLVVAGVGGLMLLFGLWWLYFLSPTGESLESRPQAAFLWGYGHYAVFASLAALGAGLEVVAASLAGHLEISGRATAYAVAVPVACFLVVTRLLHGTLLAALRLPAAIVLAVVTAVLLLPLLAGALSPAWVTLLIAVAVGLLVPAGMLVGDD